MNTVEPSDWVPQVTREAMVRLLAHAAKVGLPNTEEFTFRGLFMAAAHDLLDGPRFQTQWARFDLLVQLGEREAVIEFKYYLLRRTVGLRGGCWATKEAPARRTRPSSMPARTSFVALCCPRR